MPADQSQDDVRFTLAPLPFVFCFPGCAVPSFGSALMDGVFYISGRPVGHCRSVVFQEDGVAINYVPLGGSHAR